MKWKDLKPRLRWEFHFNSIQLKVWPKRGTIGHMWAKRYFRAKALTHTLLLLQSIGIFLGLNNSKIEVVHTQVFYLFHYFNCLPVLYGLPVLSIGLHLPSIELEIARNYKMCFFARYNDVQKLYKTFSLLQKPRSCGAGQTSGRASMRDLLVISRFSHTRWFRYLVYKRNQLSELVVKGSRQWVRSLFVNVPFKYIRRFSIRPDPLLNH